MCYTAKYLIEKALKRARHYGIAEDIRRYEEELKDFNDLEKASGFSHPKIIIYTNKEPYHPILSQWGLIPHWIRNTAQAHDIWNKTLNARGESIFEKPSFKDAAHSWRCLIPVAGFYEYHHRDNTTIPYYIARQDNEAMLLAGLWSQWINPDNGQSHHTCTIVTTQANELMAHIHNNPKAKEPRMPLILPDGKEEDWLQLKDKDALTSLLIPFPEEHLQAKPYQIKKSSDNPELW
ncbi:SOS response-associated peptidase [Carboxylicivirga sediminis]|uniref:Abasic site processing protein n=1 Tax=Carboxylicivirga sediminis TaxID=2006564 RepID=A0A941F4J5_9BACT|nr:SOS response-associated peptidase [Carboxylicivirga sediminis]MBR8536282.1 SOS response-associated peptidase [Carboxylicivirga sediminis]